jgi:presenilin-like A22 family membrane protease
MSIDLGNYQNDIPSLSALSIRDYERIFKLFKQSENDKNFYVYNILNKIDFPEIDSQYIQYYDVPTKTALTILSYNIYGDIKSWWILYLLNKDKFDGAPFYINGGTQIKYIIDSLRTSIYQDITQSTVFAGRHY